jgi:hypothetical protein
MRAVTPHQFQVRVVCGTYLAPWAEVSTVRAHGKPRLGRVLHRNGV